MQKIEISEKLGKGSGTIKNEKNASLTSENKKNDNCQKCKQPPPSSTIYIQKIEKIKIFQITQKWCETFKNLVKSVAAIINNEGKRSQ